jgi:hypothetical protein
VSTASPIINVDTFRQTAFNPATPLLVPQSGELPAIRKWFHHDKDPTLPLFSDYISQHAASILPFELIRSPLLGLDDNYAVFQAWLSTKGHHLLAQQVGKIITPHVANDPSATISSFHQFSAPLDLLLKAIEFNKQQEDRSARVKHLYVAQSQLDDLPEPLQDDLPVPDFVKLAGKGDIYSSSIWLGLESTYTPLHRDPNPNLFVQMAGAKMVRMMPPNYGRKLYSQVQHTLGNQLNSDRRIRGPEMMEGAERAALHEAVWSHDAPDATQEAIVTPGDSLFIPLGWWHSFQSVFDDGRLNASVNWWFR